MLAHATHCSWYMVVDVCAREEAHNSSNNLDHLYLLLLLCLTLSGRWRSKGLCVFNIQSYSFPQEIKISCSKCYRKEKTLLAILLQSAKLLLYLFQSDPEFVQWKKELTEAFTEAQRLLRRAPKFLNKSRSTVVELSKPPLSHRNSNGL